MLRAADRSRRMSAMSRISRRLLRLALLTTTVLAVGVPAAHADRWTSPDPAGDVVSWAIDGPQPCAPEAFTAAPDNQVLDLTRIRVAHSHDAVRLAASFRGTGDATMRDVAFYVDTPGRAYLVEATSYVGQPWPHVETVSFVEPVPRTIATMSCDELLGTEDSGSSTSGRSATRCRQPSMRLDGSTVTLRVHRDCLGTPRWVRVGAFVTGGDESGSAFAMDTWLPAGRAPGGFAIPAVGPKVRPGS